MTKTNDKLPTSSGLNWNCIGLSSGNCWGGTYPAPTGTSASTNINLALAGNISQIPKDPTLVSTNGDYYMYLYRTDNSFPYGAGAYIVWYARDIGAPCGRGYKPFNASGGWQQCRIYLGIN